MLLVKEVAAELRVGKSTVYELIRNAELTAARIGNSLRIPRSGLDRYLAQGGTDIELYAPRRRPTRAGR